MEIMSVTSALVGIKNAIDIARIIKDSNSSIEKAEINLKIADLIGALADAKVAIATIQEDMAEKDAEITKLKNELKISGNIFYESPYYFIKVDDKSERDGPFCQKCYDSNRKLIRLQSQETKGYWLCKECENGYMDKDYVKQQINYASSMRRERSDWRL